MVLMLGSGVAQVIALTFSPVITRLYSPSDFAVITMFLTITGMLLPFICGKYEVAIVVAGTDRHASELTALSCWIAATGTLILSVVVITSWQSINSALGFVELGRWLLLVPVAVFLGALAMIGRYVANRRSEYRLISRYMFVQAMMSVGMNLWFGWLGWGATGLLVANVVAVGLGTSWLLWTLRPAMRTVGYVNAHALRTVAYKYRDFPLMNASSSVLDTLTLAMPVFFIARMFSQDTVGFYGLLTRVAQAPLSLVSGAVTQVHLKHISDLVRERQPVVPYLLRITLFLMIFVIPPMVLLLLWAPELFAWAFGQPWRGAGELLAILIPSIAIQFVVSTVSPTCGATGNNKVGAVWKVLSSLVTLSMFLCVAPGLDIRDVMIALATTNVVLYALYFVAIIYSARNPRYVH